MRLQGGGGASDVERYPLVAARLAYGTAILVSFGCLYPFFGCW